MTHSEEPTITTDLTLYRQLEIRDADPGMLRAAIIFADRAKSIVVADVPAYEGANGLLREVATFAAGLEIDRKAKKAPILLAGKELDAQYTEATTALSMARTNLEQQTTTFRREEERKRRDAAAKAAELADKERRRLEALADKAAERGDVKRANEYEEKATYLAEAPVAAVRPLEKADGVSVRENWTFEIVDESLLPRMYLIPDTKKLGMLARALKGGSVVPGVRFYSEDTAVVRGL